MSITSVVTVCNTISYYCVSFYRYTQIYALLFNPLIHLQLAMILLGRIVAYPDNI
jgi:hypothetical protein